jgi:uncharacterized membrane protein YkvA (DUF1232 family)
LWHQIVLAVRLYRDPRLSAWLKSIVPLVAALYVVSPIDFIPDFLLGVGQVDDLGMLGLALFAGLKLIRRFAPPALVNEHLSAMGLRPDARSRAMPDTGEVIETTFTMNNRSNRRTAADGGRPVG